MRAHHLSLLGLLLWVTPPPAPLTAQVRPGIEVLLADSSQLIAGKRVALLTNQTGADRRGRRDVDLLFAARGATPAVLLQIPQHDPSQLQVLFSPEHGFQGAEDRPGLPDTTDSATGLPIYNLYTGARPSRFSPLDIIDVVLIDLQDVGVRYYTYPSTAVLLMREAARRAKKVVVLDRPNPIDGLTVQGNLRAVPGSLDDGGLDVLPLPMRHGMTLEEILRLANDVYTIHADLTIVPAAGWRRGMAYDATGLPWVKPSPNMPDLESALHYAGTCLFEAPHLSVGRGTPFAFQVIGASWLNPQAVLRRMRAVNRGKRNGLTGVEITTTTFTPHRPTDGKYDDVKLPGIQLRVTDRRRYNPARLGVALLAAVRAVHPDSFRFRATRFDQLAAGPELREAIAAARTPEEIWRTWEAPLARFRTTRAKYLLY